MHTVNSFFYVFSFCFYSQSLWSTVGWTKRFVIKRSDGVLSLPLEAGEENFNQGWDEQSVTSETKLLTPHFLSFAALKRLWSQNILYPRRSLSLVTCGFQSSKHDTCYHANCFLWVICSVVCSFFEPVRLLPPSNLLLGASTEGDVVFQTGWRSLCVSVLWLPSPLSLFFSSLKCKSHVLKIPLMGIKV